MAVMDPFDFSQSLSPQPQMPGLGGLVQPQSSSPVMMRPPKDQNDLAQRVTGWDAFFKSISNPENSMALINAGATMLQPRQAGETQMGQIAKGVAVGAATYQHQGKEKAQAERDTKRLGFEERGVAQRDTQIAQAERGLVVDEARATDVHSQNAKMLSLLDEQISAATEENTPASRELKKSLELSKKALSDAQASYYNAGTKAGGAGRSKADTKPSKEAELATAYMSTGKYPDIGSATIAAFDALNPTTKKAPEEFKLALDTTAADLAKTKFPYDEAARAAWLSDREIENTKALESYTQRTGQEMKSAPGGATGSYTDPPTKEDVEAYKIFLASHPDKADALRKKWIKEYGVEPPA